VHILRIAVKPSSHEKTVNKMKQGIQFSSLLVLQSRSNEVSAHLLLRFRWKVVQSVNDFLDGFFIRSRLRARVENGHRDLLTPDDQP